MQPAEPITLQTLQALRKSGEKLTCLTCYDAGFAQVLEAAGVEVLLVGDSLGMVLQGQASTLPVSMDDMVYHAACVARVARWSYRIVDMPYHSYRDRDEALSNARRLLREGGGQMVKLEGGGDKVAIVQHLVAQGIPVCGHLGLLPQSVKELGGYKVQGKDAAGASAILADAKALQAAGVGLLVLECVPAGLARAVTEAVDIPTIGIGAGGDCDGQVLVLYDILGISRGRRPKFFKDFLHGHDSVEAAARAFVQAVKNGEYPDAEHSY